MSSLSDLSNREKNIWASLLLDFVIALNFFPSVFAMAGGVAANSGEMADIITEVIIIAIIGSILIYWLLDAGGKKEEKDERDYQFDAKAHISGYIAISSAIAFLVGHIVLNETTKELFNFEYEALTPLQIATYMVFSLVIATFVKDLVRLFYYRRGY